MLNKLLIVLNKLGWGIRLFKILLLYRENTTQQHFSGKSKNFAYICS